MQRKQTLLLILPLIALYLSPAHAESCSDPMQPNMLPADGLNSFAVEQVFCDEFIDEQLNDQRWFKDIMHSLDHRVGHDQLNVEYDVTLGRRWSAFYDDHLDKTAFIMRDQNDRGVLIQRGILDSRTPDTDKDRGYTDPDDPFNVVNFGRGKLYTSFLKTFDTDATTSASTLNTDSKGYWRPGHFFEIRVNFGQMNMGGHRHSFWLMPATTQGYGGLSEVCGDDTKAVAADCKVENGVEIDIYEYEASPSSSRNKLYMKVLGGDAGKTTNNLSFHPPGVNYSDEYKSEVVVTPGFEHGLLNVDQWHTVGLYWGNDRLVWYLDGVPVVEDTKHVPTAPHYLLLTREMNSGVQKSKSASAIGTDYAKIPIDDGLAGENVGLRRNLEKLGRISENYQDLSLEGKDYVKTDYVRVWRINGELAPPVAPAGSTDASKGTVLVTGNIIELSNGNRFEARPVGSNKIVCEADDGPCQVAAGDYIVSDVDDGERYIISTDSELPVEKSVSEKNHVFILPRGQYYEIQSAEGDYESICKGTTRCLVKPGKYNVINHDQFDNPGPNGRIHRYNNWTVSDSIASSIYIDDNNVIVMPENGWFQVQQYPDFNQICEGVFECAVEPGQYVVINHWSDTRYEVNARNVAGEFNPIIGDRTLDLNDARSAMSIANAEDFYEVLRLLATARTKPDLRPSIADNLGTPTMDLGGVASVIINGEEFNYQVSRNCPGGGAVYLFTDTNMQFSLFDYYYDNCQFSIKQDMVYLPHEINGRYSNKKLANLEVSTRDYDMFVRINTKTVQMKGSLVTTSKDSNYRTIELSMPLLVVSTPSSAYTSYNVSVITEWERDNDTPIHLAKEHVTSRIRLSSFNTEKVNDLIRTEQPLELNDAKNSIIGGRLVVESGNTMGIEPVEGTNNEFTVTLQATTSTPERSRQVLMEGLRPAKSGILAR